MWNFGQAVFSVIVVSLSFLETFAGLFLLTFSLASLIVLIMVRVRVGRWVGSFKHIIHFGTC